MQTFNLDISLRGVTPLLHAKQGDVGRKFKVILTEGGNPYTVPDGVDVSVWYSGVSGVGNYTKIDEESAVSITGNEMTVELISQMLNNAGEGTLCLVMKDADSRQLGTWNITYIVQAVPGFGSKPAEQHFSVVDKYIEDAINKKAFVKTVNGIGPDENGNVNVEGGSGLTSAEKSLLLSLFKNAAYTADMSAIIAQLETLWSGGDIPDEPVEPELPEADVSQTGSVLSIVSGVTANQSGSVLAIA